MMSERPSGGGGGGGGGDGGAGAGVSIGNYKGVMLCNRPFAGATAGAHAGGGGSSDKPAPFITGINKEGMHPRGWDPSKRERKNTVPERNYKNTALSKHKQWLRRLQKQRDAAIAKAEEDEVARAARHEAFLAQQQRMRDVVRGLADVDDSADAAAAGDGITGSGFDANAQERALQQGILTAAQQRKVKASTKPAWAYTAEAKEKAEEEEADALLRFAESLDFEKYLDDLDVRAAMEVAQAQLEALEKERAEEDEAEAEEKAALEAEAKAAAGEGDEGKGGEESKSERKVVALNAESLKQFDANNAASGEDAPRRKDLDAGSVMTAASAAESIRSVHSKKSLQAVIDRERRKKLGASMPAIAEAEAPKVAAPRIVTHDDTDGSRIKNKSLVSQLPYMNRNPAV